MSKRITGRSLRALLTAVMGVAPAPVYAVTALSPLLLGALGLSEQDLGVIVGLAFVVAAAASLPVGRLVDRLGGAAILFAIGLATSATLAALALELSFVALMGAAVVSGVAQGAANPATNQIIATTLPLQERPHAVSVKQSGVPLSQLLIGAAVPLVAGVLGAGTAFIALTAVAAVIAGWGAWVLARWPATTSRKPTAARQPHAIGIRIGALLAVSFFSGAAAQAANTYLPLYGHTGIGLSAATAGTIVGIIGALGIAGRLVWSHLYGRTGRKGALLPALSSVGMVAYGLLALVARAALPDGFYWVAIALHALSTLAVTVVVYLNLMEWVPRSAIGVMSGYVGISQFVGFAVGPPVMGVTVTHFGYGAAWAVVTACGALALSSALVLTRTGGRDAGGRHHRH